MTPCSSSALPSDNRGADRRRPRRRIGHRAAATTADVAGEILLIAGDGLTPSLLRRPRTGLRRRRWDAWCDPAGRPGNPDSDTDWFVTDWMDTTRAQEALQFQHYSWSDVMAELSARFGSTRYPGRLIAPVVREVMKRRAAYRNAPGQYADPWGAIRAKLGDPSWDRPNGPPDRIGRAVDDFRRARNSHHRRGQRHRVSPLREEFAAPRRTGDARRHRSSPPSTSAVATLRADGIDAHGVRCDVRKLDDVDHLADEAFRRIR